MLNPIYALHLNSMLASLAHRRGVAAIFHVLGVVEFGRAAHGKKGLALPLTA